MVWIVIIIVGGFFLLKFLFEFVKDKAELHEESISSKFSYLIDILNQSAFIGTGKINVTSQNELNLHRKGGNQIIYLIYGAGSLTIIWKYAYVNNEIIHEERFRDVRDLSTKNQETIGICFVKGMLNKAQLIDYRIPIVAQIEKYINDISPSSNIISIKDIKRIKYVERSFYLMSVNSTGQVEVDRSSSVDGFAYNDNSISYDYEGKITDEVSVKNRVRIMKYKYDSNSRIVSEIETVDPKEDNPAVYGKNYIYDQNNRLIQRNDYSNKGHSGSEVYEYDSTGRIIRENHLSSIMKLERYLLYNYDQIGNRVERIRYNSDGIYQSRTLYKYDTIGNLIEDHRVLELVLGTYFDEDGEHEEYQSNYNVNRTTYKYDSLRNLIEMTEYVEQIISESDNSIVKTVSQRDSTFTYQLDKFNNWISRISFEDGRPKYFAERVIEYY